jgi:hypothetical protein
MTTIGTFLPVESAFVGISIYQIVLLFSWGYLLLIILIHSVCGPGALVKSRSKKKKGVFYFSGASILTRKYIMAQIAYRFFIVTMYTLYSILYDVPLSKGNTL